MKQLNKIIKTILAEQLTISDAGKAKQIYNAKGFVWDNEYAALKAILAIKDINQFNSVQKELQKLTGGRGIGQYVSEFIVVRDSMNSYRLPITIRYIKSIISHLTKIGAYKQTIDIFAEKLKQMEKWSKINADLASSGAGQTQFAWETFAQRAAVDPEFKHNYLTSLQILASFIPVVGWAYSAGIGLGNAYVYYQEGDPKTAGIEAIFSLIPGLGLAGKLGLNKIAPKVMANLGKKVLTKQTKNLTKQEIRILDLIGKNQKALKTELDNYFRTGIMKSAKQISRDKLAAAGTKYASAIAKGTGEFASYAAIAQLYNYSYDNATDLTAPELIALNNKVDSEFTSWLDTQPSSTIADAMLPHTNSESLTEADVTPIGDMIWNSGPYLKGALGVATTLSVIAIAVTIKKVLIKLPLKFRFDKWNKMRRDRNTFKALGIDPGNIRKYYNSGEALQTTKDAWNEIEKLVASGEMTPRDAMAKLDFLRRPGVANKVFNKLTKAYNKKIHFRDKDYLVRFIKELPEPKRGIGYNAQSEYDAAMKLWKQKNTMAEKLDRVVGKLGNSDPDYNAWFEKHLENKNYTEKLKDLNRFRYAKYTAFLTIVGGLAGLKTYAAYAEYKKKLDAGKKLDAVKKLDAAKKTRVSFKGPAGSSIPVYTWSSQTKTWKDAGNITIPVPHLFSAVMKLWLSTDKTHTLITGLPGSPDKYYWVLTNTLNTTAAPVQKKKTLPPKKEPVADPTPETTPPPPAETPGVSGHAVDPG